MRRLINNLLCLIVCFTLIGCNQGEIKEKQKTEAMGRYVEETCKVEELIDENGSICLWKDEANKLHAMIKNEVFEDYKLTESGEWEKSNCEICNVLNRKDKVIESVSRIQVQEDGSYYVGGMGEVDADYPDVFGGFIVNGEINTIQLEGEEDSEGYSRVFISEIDKKGNIIGESGDWGALALYNKEGKKLVSLTERHCNPIIIGEKMFGVGEDTLDIYDLKTGNKEKTISNIDAYGYWVNTFYDEQNNIFIACKEGVTRVNQDGDIIEKIIDGKLCLLSSYDAIQGMIYNSEIYLVYRYYDKYNKQQIKVKKYTYDESVPTVPKEVLTVWGVTESETLRRAVASYRQIYPDRPISFETLYSASQWEEQNAMVKQDDLDRLNTEILAGEGPDVLLLDALSIDIYGKQGIFADLSDLLNNPQEPILNNLAQAYKNEEGIYAIPLRFSMLLAIGEKELLDEGFSLEKIAAYQEEHKNEKVMFKIHEEDRINMMMDLWQGKLIDNEGHANEEAITSYLTSLNSIIRKNSNGWGGEDWRVGFTPQTALSINLMKADIVKVSAMPELQSIINILEQMPNCIMTDNIEGQKNIVQPQQIVAISKNSKHQEAAKDFINLALSSEAQEDEEMFNSFQKEGLPTNSNALIEILLNNQHRKEKTGENRISYNKWMDAGEYGGALGSELQEFGHLDEMKNFLEQCKTAKVQKPIDETVRRLIGEEGMRYFNEEITLETAVNNILEKMELHMMEQAK